MRRRRLWLAGGLLCGLLGCSGTGQRQLDNRLMPPPPRQVSHSTPTSSYTQNTRKAKDEPSQVLLAKPSTCVQMADFYANCAAEENRPDGERQRFAAEARKTYRRALQQDPKYLTAYLGLGRLAESMDERDEAVAIYNEALTHHPKEATIWFERGVSLSRMKRFDEALASYQRAAQLDSKNRTYNVSAGYMLAMMGRHDEALVWLKRFMSDASARYSLALALRRQGQSEKGRQQLALALRAEPNHKAALELMTRWDDVDFHGSEEPLQQTGYAAPAEAKVAAPASVPPAVVIKSTTQIDVPTATQRQPAEDSSSRPVEKADVNWSKAGSNATAKSSHPDNAPVPLIPVLSEHWEKKPTAPPPLNGPAPSKQPVAKLGFEDQP